MQLLPNFIAADDRRMSFWDQLREQLFAPKVSQAEVERALEAARAALPTPVIWLLGKSQAGKTSIIRALTGAPQAEIGDGFRPCTRTARIYDFPADAEPIVRFLDTRGLGEAAYDPSDDLTACQNQANLVMVVVRAMDHALAPLTEPLRRIRRQRPHWPLIIAQTCLHDGYPQPADQHADPYQMDQWPLPEETPAALARSLSAQRETLAEFGGRFVPIDFTPPEDGFEQPLYGLAGLWDAIEDALPHGLHALLSQSPEMKRPWSQARQRAAYPQILSYALAAGAVAATPAPLVEMPLVLGIHAKMFHALASIYEQPLSRQRIAEISSMLGVGYLARMGGRSLMKLAPGVGSVAAAIYTSAATYALGQSLCYYFARVQEGDAPDAQSLRRVYAAQYEEGRRRVAGLLQQLPERPPEPT